MSKVVGFLKKGVNPYCPYCFANLGKDANGSWRPIESIPKAYSSHIALCEKSPAVVAVEPFFPNGLKETSPLAYKRTVYQLRKGWQAFAEHASQEGITLNGFDPANLPPMPEVIWTPHWKEWEHLYKDIPKGDWNPIGHIAFTDFGYSGPSAVEPAGSEKCETCGGAKYHGGADCPGAPDEVEVPGLGKVPLDKLHEAIEKVQVMGGSGGAQLPSVIVGTPPASKKPKPAKKTPLTPSEVETFAAAYEKASQSPGVHQAKVSHVSGTPKSAHTLMSPTPTMPSHVSTMNPLVTALGAASEAGAYEVINAMKAEPIKEFTLKMYEQGAFGIVGNPSVGDLAAALGNLTHGQLKQLLQAAVFKGVVNIPGLSPLAPDDNPFVAKGAAPMAKANIGGAQAYQGPQAMPSGGLGFGSDFLSEVMAMQKAVMMERMKMEMMKQMFAGEPLNPWKGGAYDANMHKEQQNAAFSTAVKEAIEEATAPLKAQLAVYEKQSEAQKLAEVVKQATAPLQMQLDSIKQAAAAPQHNGNQDALLMALNNLTQSIASQKADFAMAVKDAAMAKSGDFNVNTWMQMQQQHMQQVKELERQAEKMRVDLINGILQEKEARLQNVMEAKGGSGLEEFEKSLAIMEKFGVNPKDLLKAKSAPVEDSGTDKLLEVAKVLGPVVGQVMAARAGMPPQPGMMPGSPAYGPMPPPGMAAPPMAAANKQGHPGAQTVTLVEEDCFACGVRIKLPVGGTDAVTCPSCISVFMPDGSVKLSTWAAEIRKLAGLVDPSMGTPAGTIEKLQAEGKLQAKAPELGTANVVKPGPKGHHAPHVHQHSHAPPPQKIPGMGVIYADEDGPGPAPVKAHTHAPPAPSQSYDTSGVAALDVPVPEDEDVD